MRKFGLAAVAVLALGQAARADVPDVAVDIAPVHSLAAKVMEGVGSPDLVVRPGASPHGYAMRPSEAAALERADVVFFVSHNLTGWFEEALEPLAGDATVVELLEAEGSTEWPKREDALFLPHSHDDDHDAHDHEEGHEHEEGHDHAEEHDHAEGHDHAEDHDHDAVDPHAWLDPENAKLWLDVIAETLAEADPDNAAAYRANAAEGQAGIDAASEQVKDILAHAQAGAFFVHHDAYQYFEKRFALAASGSISGGDAAQPGPKRIAALREAVEGLGVVCVFSEPQFNAGLLHTVFEGHELRQASLDPLGTKLEPGPALYPQLLVQMASDVAECLGQE